MATFGDIKNTFDNGDSHNNSGSIANGSGSSSAFKLPFKKGTAESDNFLKGLTAEKKMKADGQPPKRRGPKPDAKPALTRRQELNRQAQRTHRERKEMYIKCLEQEVMRLKDMYADVCRSREMIAEQNKKIREILEFNKLGHLLSGLPVLTAHEPSSSGSISGTYQDTASTTTDGSPQPMMDFHSPIQAAPVQRTNCNHTGGINFEQLGIDFVLTLERPCMDHMQMLCVNSQNSESDISGHAMMATCPPRTHVIEHPEINYPHKMPELQSSDLVKLLDLSSRLALDSEITPIMAWVYLLKHPRHSELTPDDIVTIREELATKVRCYGFGAVLEEFEVTDAVERVFTSRMDVYMGYD